MKKRVISWLLTVVMVVSLLPTSVLADTLAADQEQQTQQEQIAPADTENTVPAENEETQEQQEPAEEVPVSQMTSSGGRRGAEYRHRGGVCRDGAQRQLSIDGGHHRHGALWQRYYRLYRLYRHL